MVVADFLLKKLVILGIVMILFVSFPSVMAPDGDNSPPNAEAGGPYSGFVGEPITFDGSGSRDSDYYITGYHWDWTNDGTYDTDWLSEPTTTHAYSTPGSYTLKLEVKDSGDEYGNYIKMAIDTAPVTITARPPDAQFTYNPRNPTIKEKVQFTDTSIKGSYDINSWLWNFGDGLTSTEQNPTHQYQSNGYYAVRLTITDAYSQSDTETKSLTVINIRPTAFIDEINPNPVFTGTTVIFKGHGVDEDGVILAYNWSSDVDSWLSEKPDFETNNLSKGTHNITFRVKDDDNTWSQNVTEKLVITDNLPPDKPIISGKTSGKTKIEQEYKINTTDPEGNNVFYFVDWGDGTNSSWLGSYDSGEEITAKHVWNVKGNYTIKVKAKDIFNGESDWATLTVTMPYSYNKPMPHFVELLFQRFPNAFPLLRHLMGY